MRIVGGFHRGRTLHPPRNLQARPTTDFAKENLFNVLRSRIDFASADVLDLFAGTGSIGYEFASVGLATGSDESDGYTGSVTAVEINPAHAEFIRRTALSLNLPRFFVVKANVFFYLQKVQKQFDVIFSDAPYDLPDASRVIETVFARSLLKPEGVLIFEHSAAHDFAAHPHLIDTRTYGSVRFSIFR